MSNPQHITLIGFGKMGQALHNGWQTAGLNATIIDPAAASTNPDIYASAEAAAAPLAQATVIVLAVKPQIMKQVCAGLKPHIPDNALILSIAAGQTLTNYGTYFGPEHPVIRTMPNTPAAIGKGISVSVASPTCTPEHKATADTLLAPTGQHHWLEDEALMNAVTAVSGSGPAYLFYFIEALTEAAKATGLPADLAEALARQTIIGSAHLVEHEAATPAATLRENVTSPGGTTAAALERLMDGEFQTIINEAVNKAIKRGEEL